MCSPSLAMVTCLCVKNSQMGLKTTCYNTLTHKLNLSCKWKPKHQRLRYLHTLWNLKCKIYLSCCNYIICIFYRMLEIEEIFSQFFDTELFDKVRIFLSKPATSMEMFFHQKWTKKLYPPPLQLLYNSPRSYVLLAIEK